MRILRTLVLGLNTLLLPACSHNAGHAKTLDRAITEEGRICAREFNACKIDHFKKNPNASRTEPIPACEKIKTTCLEDAHNRLIAE